MKYLVIVFIAYMVLATSAVAHPTYQWCYKHGYCTHVHRAFRIQCAGSVWFSPRPVRVPFRAHEWWCEENIPGF